MMLGLTPDQMFACLNRVKDKVCTCNSTSTEVEKLSTQSITFTLLLLPLLAKRRKNTVPLTVNEGVVTWKALSHLCVLMSNDKEQNTGCLFILDAAYQLVLFFTFQTR